MAKIHLIIPAAGSSLRMGQPLPKQFTVLGNNKTLIEIVESVFSRISQIDSINIAVSKEQNHIEILKNKFSNKTHIHYCGGATRAETVLNTINQIKCMADDWVMVHDAARIGITEVLIHKFIDAIGKDKVGGIMALPASDTLKRVNKLNEIISTENRDEIWLAQTPQMFRFKLLKKALENFDGIPTDESEAIEFLGHRPKLFKGIPLNFKVTFPDDIKRAEKSLEILRINKHD